MISKVSDDNEKKQEYDLKHSLKKKIIALAKTAEFGKEYEVDDGIYISFNAPEGR